MKTIDIMRRAGNSLRQAKARTLLTSLAIGVGAFTVTLSLAAGTGTREYTDKLISSNVDAQMLIVGKDKSLFGEGGGMAAGEGRVRTQHLLRSDFPQSFGAESVEYMQEVPVSAVIDLRTDPEIESQPRYFKDAGFNVVKIPILSGSIKSMMAKVPDVGNIDMTAVAALATGSPADAIQDAFATIRKEHGTVEAFVLANGLTQEEIDSLKDTLIVK